MYTVVSQVLKNQKKGEHNVNPQASVEEMFDFYRRGIVKFEPNCVPYIGLALLS